MLLQIYNSGMKFTLNKFELVMAWIYRTETGSLIDVFFSL